MFICQCFRVFSNGAEDRGSIPGRVLQKTVLLNTDNHKVRIKGKWRIPGK